MRVGVAEGLGGPGLDGVEQGRRTGAAGTPAEAFRLVGVGFGSGVHHWPLTGFRAGRPADDPAGRPVLSGLCEAAGVVGPVGVLPLDRRAVNGGVHPSVPGAGHGPAGGALQDRPVVLAPEAVGEGAQGLGPNAPTT